MHVHVEQPFFIVATGTLGVDVGIKGRYSIDAYQSRRVGCPPSIGAALYKGAASIFLDWLRISIHPFPFGYADNLSSFVHSIQLICDKLPVINLTIPAEKPHQNLIQIGNSLVIISDHCYDCLFYLAHFSSLKFFLQLIRQLRHVAESAPKVCW